jgi:serine/threonine-protein kinase HipA
VSARLYAHCRGSLVGVLEPWSFEYAPSWLTSAGFELSSSLPLRAEPYGEEARLWFGNLLPEGAARERIARRHRLDPDDDFALLVALGGECAGAVTLDVDLEPPPPAASPRYHRLSEGELADLLRFGSGTPWLRKHARLSLAGAQDKVPVRLDSAGQLCLPVGSAASTHLLKLPSRDDAAIIENELLGLELARRIGLDVVTAEPFVLAGVLSLLVRRYDRAPSEPRLPQPSRTSKSAVLLSPVHRMHQEDFAQALGRGRRNKYEADQGPTLADCARLIRRNGQEPATELRSLLRWVLYCLLIGNRDNHAKNLSRILDEATGRWRLAPFYDLLNTTAYKRLSPELAFHIGGEARVRRLTPAHWEMLAAQLEVSPRLVRRELGTMVERVQAELPEAVAAIAQAVGSDARLVQFSRAIGKALRVPL